MLQRKCLKRAKSSLLELLHPADQGDTVCDCVFYELSRHAKSYGIISLNEILHEVQSHHVFIDSKEFVDMPMKHHPRAILHAWHCLKKKLETEGQPVNKDVLLPFVMEHFMLVGRWSYRIWQNS